MKTSATFAALALGLTLGAGPILAQTSQAPTKEPNKVGPANSIDCQSKWNAAEPSSDGTISPAALARYGVRMSQVDTDGNGRITQTEFMNACQAGLIRG